MRLLLACTLAAAIAGCYDSHTRPLARDAGPDDAGEPSDAGRPMHDAARYDAGGFPRDADLPPDAGACAEGSACNDGDACTTGDRCTGGLCAGTPISCDLPPPPSHCLDDETLRTYASSECAAGACTHPPEDRRCPDGCVDGACACIARPWVTSTVDPGPPGIGGVSPEAIAIDAAGGVHVAYMLQDDAAPFEQRIAYARRPLGGAWTFEPVGPAMGTAALRIDASGTVHVLYRRRTSPHEAVWVHAQRSGSGWSSTDLTLPPGRFGDAREIQAADVDASGRVHALWRRSLTPGYSVHAGGTWTVMEEHGAIAYWWPLTIRVDAAGEVHALYGSTTGVAGDPSRYALRYARRTATGWTRSDVVAQPDPISSARLDVPAPGSVHVLYPRATEGPWRSLRYAFLSASGTWTIETIVDNVGFAGALVVDAAGAVHVSYELPSTEGQIGYAYRDPATGAWSTDPVPLAADFVMLTGSSALAVDRDGGVHMAYSRILEPLGYAFRRDCR